MSPALCFLFFRTLGGGACLCKSASVPLRKVAADRIRALGEHRKGWPCLPASGLAGLRALRFAYLLSLRVGSCGPSVTHWPVLASHISSSPEPSELPWHSPCLPKPQRLRDSERADAGRVLTRARKYRSQNIRKCFLHALRLEFLASFKDCGPCL